MKRSKGIYILSFLLAAFINNCSGQKIDKDAVNMDRLAGCPDRPNCVSSEAKDDKHAITPLRLKENQAVAWNAIRDTVSKLPRTRIVKFGDRYLHAECRSRLFGFIDDLELQLDPQTGLIAIRSASRIGYSDLGVNRRRVETLQQKLKQDGLIH